MWGSMDAHSLRTKKNIAAQKFFEIGGGRVQVEVMGVLFVSYNRKGYV